MGRENSFGAIRSQCLGQNPERGRYDAVSE